MLVLVGIKVSQFGGIARKMTWFQVSGCHSLQFPWHFVCETWCQRFVAGGVRATRRDLKLRTKMFWECVYVDVSMNVYRDVAASPDCSIQKDSERRPPLLLLLRAMPGGRSHFLMILSHFGKRKWTQLLGERTWQDKKVEIQRFPAAFPIL